MESSVFHGLITSCYSTHKTFAKCPPGYEGLGPNLSKPCKARIPGNFSKYGLTCEPGTYAPSSGLATCLKYGSGYIAAAFGITKCTPCPPGTFTTNGVYCNIPGLTFPSNAPIKAPV